MRLLQPTPHSLFDSEKRLTFQDSGLGGVGMIEVEHLTKRFSTGDGKEVSAVEDLSFVVQPGEVYGLLGPNGAGKTTTVRMILGLLPPTSGYAGIDGFRSMEQPREVKRRVGLVAASTGVYQGLTSREMLLYFADLYDVPPEEAKQELARLSALLDLGEFLDRRCAVLSTGQKQRLQLARALIHRPPVMLLDEPTLGLDVIGAQVVNEYVAVLRDQGKAVILCTHQMDEAERLCDRLGLLNHGRLVSEGTLEELRERTGCRSLHEMFLQLSGTGPTLKPERFGNGMATTEGKGE